ncbi:hypothetical protein R3P38DRAFT_3225185 [Favolaschia claudopus]|uniref:Uncharacterized protein n=1 Tax=Favolaschia claudopus TaxID=2862362 RepID=A0AAV9ZV43_9AGAR
MRRGTRCGGSQCVWSAGAALETRERSPKLPSSLLRTHRIRRFVYPQPLQNQPRKSTRSASPSPPPHFLPLPSCAVPSLTTETQRLFLFSSFHTPSRVLQFSVTIATPPNSSGQLRRGFRKNSAGDWFEVSILTTCTNSSHEEMSRAAIDHDRDGHITVFEKVGVFALVNWIVMALLRARPTPTSMYSYKANIATLPTRAFAASPHVVTGSAAPTPRRLSRRHPLPSRRRRRALHTDVDFVDFAVRHVLLENNEKCAVVAI